MLDERVSRMAAVLVRHSLAIKAGDRVLVHAPCEAAALVEEVYREVLRAGAHPTVRMSPQSLPEIALTCASADQLASLAELDAHEMERVDAWLVIDAPVNTKALAGAPDEQAAVWRGARAKLMGRCVQRITEGRMRWCRTVFPTHALAQEAGMSLPEYERVLFRACLLEDRNPVARWQELHARQQRIVEFLDGVDELRVHGPGVDLTCRVGGRRWVNGSGTFNFPDGEVFTSPIEDSMSGTIAFSNPAVYDGVAVSELVLTFEQGRVADFACASNYEFVQAMLATDDGARRVGEIAFGLNDHVRQFTGNTLFDEKLGGTMHIALGRSYPHTGGENGSAIHWDMVTSLAAGAVDADGEPCYADGGFLGSVVARAARTPVSEVAELRALQ